MKRAIIIGASSGIGFELARSLAKDNYKIAITGRRKLKLEKLAKENPENLLVMPFDCTQENNTLKLSEIVEELGGLDLLILSSGTGDLNENLDYNIENNTNQLNVIAFAEILNWSYKYFEKQKFGHIAAISSIAGIRGSRIAPAYNASKAYQINYLEGLRQKANKAKSEISITDIRPGFVDTDMAKGDGQFWVSTVEKASKQIIRAIYKKKDIVYVTKRWGIIACTLKRIPNFIFKKL